MAAFPTTRLVLFAEVLKSGQRSVALRVTYQRKSKYFFLNRQCLPEQWDAASARFLRSFPDYRRENDLLLMYERRASDALREMERDGIPFTFERFERAVFGSKRTAGATLLHEAISAEAADLDKIGKHGNANIYKQAANTVRAFRPKATLAEIDAAWLSKFERWLIETRGATGGGLSVLFRTVRATCKRVIKAGNMPEAWFPFAAFSLSHMKSRKAQKSAPLDFIRALEGLADLSKPEQFTRDLFLFSFYCRGINMVDIADLKRSNIRAGRLEYARAKTGGLFSIGLRPAALEIIERYADKGSEYLFPIYSPGLSHSAKLSRRNNLRRRVIAPSLAALAERAGFSVPGLTFYTARHTYADSLKKKGAPVEVISQLLGHRDIRTTDNYLRAFGDDVLDAADRLLE